MPGRVVTVRLPRELLTTLNALCRKRRRRAAGVLAACLDEHMARPLAPAAIQATGPLTRRRTFRVSPDLHAKLKIFARGGDMGPLDPAPPGRRIYQSRTPSRKITMSALKTAICASANSSTHPVMGAKQASPETQPVQFALKTEVKTSAVNHEIQLPAHCPLILTHL